MARHYSESFKAGIVERLLMPNAPRYQDVSDETGVPTSSLSRWVTRAVSLGAMAKKKEPKAPPPEAEPRSTRAWSPAEKLRVVGAAAQLTDDELGAFLRREGLHAAQLEEWRNELLIALGSPPPRPTKQDAQRIRELERDLARKDRALAEVTALLVLRKKLEALFGTMAGEGDSTDEENGKKR
jgi:transposase